MTSIAPFLIFFVAAALAAITRGHLRSVIMLATPVVGAINLWYLDPATTMTFTLVGREVLLLNVDRLSLLFGWLFHTAAFIAVVYSLHMNDRMQHVAALAYAGCALGAVFAGDFLGLFLFWEGLALTSAFLILARRTREAERATVRYLVLQVLSGILLLAGVLALTADGRPITLSPLELEGLAAWLIFLALGIKCGFPLLHTWITDAYPAATETGTVLMSAFTTKVAVYALARLFPGTEELIWIGGAMAMFPIFYAVIENDLRRVLAYSMINQLGFMVVGIGIGTEMAINGSISHAFNDVIFKGLLFMSMGAVLYRTGRMNGSDLGGLYRTMPKTTGFCIVGAASISAFPLFSGFVSKSMIMVAALDQGYDWIWLTLLFASAGVFHHAGIKIPFFAFFAHDSGLRPKEAPTPMLIAMGIAAFLCIFNGVYPWLLYDMLPYPVDYAPYTWEHVLTQCQLLFFSALAFALLKQFKLYPPELPSVNLDAEWTYRWLLPRVARRGLAVLSGVVAPIRDTSVSVMAGITGLAMRWHGPSGIFARDPVISMASLAIVVVFAFVLVVHLIRGA
ncbi:MAG: Na(+)/H(+) antiporter subunit D [Alphaproteobacteria bacterium]|jgi:multicomponent Na+:H+ antiporter subunit D|nr:Na(+)/H(+) antiporter subunit D [Alphaproteobacteria bacterium]